VIGPLISSQIMIMHSDTFRSKMTKTIMIAALSVVVIQYIIILLLLLSHHHSPLPPPPAILQSKLPPQFTIISNVISRPQTKDPAYTLLPKELNPVKRTQNNFSILCVSVGSMAPRGLYYATGDATQVRNVSHYNILVTLS
jgi:hypothetical protein